MEISWLYCIDLIGTDDKEYDCRYRYRVRWSIPTRRTPIPRATASVYFTIDGVHHKTKGCTYSTFQLYNSSKGSGQHQTGTSNEIARLGNSCLNYSIIWLYRTRLYRNSVYIELQSAVPPDTMFINTKDGYIETRIYRSIYHGPLNFDITGL